LGKNKKRDSNDRTGGAGKKRNARYVLYKYKKRTEKGTHSIGVRSEKKQKKIENRQRMTHTKKNRQRNDTDNKSKRKGSRTHKKEEDKMTKIKKYNINLSLLFFLFEN